MNAHVHESANEDAAISQRRLFGSLAAGPVAWALHGAVSSALSGWACSDGDLALGVLSGGGVRVLLGTLTVLAIGVALWGGSTAWRIRRTTRAEHDTPSEPLDSRVRFMAHAALLVTALSVVGLIYALIPVIVESVCGKVR